MSILQKAWTAALRGCLLPAGDLLAGQRMLSRLKFLEEAQWWDRNKIENERCRLLEELVRVSYEQAPFYKELMDRSGVRPGQIRTPGDLKKIPFVTKAMIRRAYPEKMLRNTGQKIYESRTSGSTGENFAVMEDAATAGWYRASFLLALEWSGWSLGEPSLQTGMTLERGVLKKTKDVLMRTSYFSAFDLSDAHLDRMLDRLDGTGIEYLWGYPGSLYCLAQRAGRKGWNRPLKSAVTWGDALYPKYRAEIERVFKTKVFDTYGCAEGMQIAAQCEKGSYHLHDLDVVVEFLDENGNEAPEGREANLVITRLHPGPMPLVRYRIGDAGMNGAGQCSCGRGFAVMQGLRGRETDVVITPAGNRLIVHFFTGIFEHFSAIENFQVVQEAEKDLRVFVTPARVDKNLETALRRALEEKGLTGMDVKIEFVAEIPLKAGKRRFVINKAYPAQEPSSA